MDTTTYEKYTRKTLFAEAAGEYVLPDYLGDVKRILSTEETLIPAGDFVSEGEIRFSGTVEFRVLFEDSEGGICEVTFPGDYETVLRYDTERLSSAASSARLDGASYRPSGPRKITARATVVIRETLGERVSLEVGGDGFASAREAVVRTQEVKTAKILAPKQLEKETAEEVCHLTAEEGEVVILASSVSSMVDEIAGEDGDVTVKGHHTVSVLLKKGAEPVFEETQKISFAVTFEGEGTGEGASYTAEARVSSQNVALRRDPDGVTAVTASLVGSYTLRGTAPETFEILTDGYLVGAASACGYDDFCAKAPAGVGTAVLTLNAQGDEGGECAGANQILRVSPSVKLTRAEAVDGGISVDGELVFGLVGIAADGESGRVCREKITTSFRETVSAPGILPGDSVEIYASVGEGSGKIYDGRTAASVALSVGYTAFRPFHTPRMSRLEEVETAPAPQGRVTVYYPTATDTVWDVAKAYRIKEDKLRLDNGLTTDSLEGRERIFILP